MKNKKGQIGLGTILLIALIILLVTGTLTGFLVAFNLNKIPFPIWLIIIILLGWIILKKKR